MSGLNAKRCGTCHFGKFLTQDVTKRICWGAPPTPLQVTGKGAQVTVQMARPVVSISDDACALYRGKDADDVKRDQDALDMLQAKLTAVESQR